MTWDELTDLLTKLGEEFDLKVHVVRRDGLDTVALHIVPVAWFIAMKFTGSLNMGRYEGDEHRLVGTGQIPPGRADARICARTGRAGRGEDDWLGARS